MFRTFIWFIYFWGALVWHLPRLWKVNRLQRKGLVEEYRQTVDEYSRQWMGNLLKLAGLKLKISGIENIPKDEAILYVANHQGYFDIPVCITALPGITGFIAKKESEKFPIVRKWMQHMNCVLMDRKNPRHSVKAIESATQSLKEGKSMVIFPEGTRSSDGQLGRFKPGALKLAIRSGVKVIPVTINGTKNAMKKGRLRIRPTEVEIVLSEPMSYGEKYGDSIVFTEAIKTVIATQLVD